MKWWQIKKRDEDLERELRSDLELEEEEQRERGLSPEEARYAARRAFGNEALIREQTHEAWGWVWLERLRQDLRDGLRQLIRNPGFTAVAVLTLALAVGVNTTIFSAVSAILLRKPPVKVPDTLCAVSSKNILRGYDLVGVSAPDFESWQKDNHVFAEMAAVERGRSFTLTGKNEAESVHGDRVTPDFFAAIGVMPALGRPFLPSEDEPGSDHEVILSASLWRERFAGDPDAVGRDLEIDGTPYKIVGVMPPLGNISGGSQTQLWTPLVFTSDDLSAPARANHYIDLVLGRLKPGIPLTQAEADMDSIARRLAQNYNATNQHWGITVLTLQEYNIRSENVRNAMVLLMIAVGLVLLTACGNVAGLLLTRGACRTHELAVRSALGASRARIFRQMMTESLLIGVASSGAGLLISLWGIRLLRAAFDFNEFGRQIGDRLHLDPPTLLFTLAIALLTTVVFGLLPAIQSSKVPPRGALSQTSRTASAGGGSSRLRKILVVAEVAAAVVLLAAAGVDMREVLRELNEPNGFNSQHLVTLKVDVSGPRYKQWPARIALFEQVTEKLRSLPGVNSVTADSCVPMGCFYSAAFHVLGQEPHPASELPSAQFFVVGPEYFHTMQIPILRGRGFATDDNARDPIVALVNEEFARRFFPKKDTLGRQIEVEDGNHEPAQIVGIVGNVNNSVGQLHPRPQIYESYLQVPVNAFSTMTLIVRSRGPNKALAPLLRHVVWSVDQAQPAGVTPMEDLINDNLGGDKLMDGLMGLFGGLALGLAGLGIYGVIAYSVAQRTQEIGIRMALGAGKRDILGLTLREGGVLIGIGCAVGIVPALLLPKLFSGVLNGFALQGPSVAIGAGLAVSLVAWFATYLPARRAMNVDPMRALRSE